MIRCGLAAEVPAIVSQHSGREPDAGDAAGEPRAPQQVSCPRMGTAGGVNNAIQRSLHLPRSRMLVHLQLNVKQEYIK